METSRSCRSSRRASEEDIRSFYRDVGGDDVVGEPGVVLGVAVGGNVVVVVVGGTHVSTRPSPSVSTVSGSSPQLLARKSCWSVRRSRPARCGGAGGRKAFGG